jgi:anti-sigma factor RsiW
MVCRDVLELIEPIVAGDLSPDDEVRAHLESCVGCAAALASAQRLESALKGMEFPPAPAGFATMVLRRIRSDRWQAEQRVDQLFNLAIVAAVLLMAGAVVAMLNVETVLALSGSALVLLREGVRTSVRDAAPQVSTYIAAAGLLASALAMWWWAERRLMF